MILGGGGGLYSVGEAGGHGDGEGVRGLYGGEG